MTPLKKRYEEKKEKVLTNPKLSRLQRDNQLFGLWIDYIYNSAEKGREQAIKYEREKVRVNVKTQFAQNHF